MYSLQDVLINKTFDNIASSLFDPQFHDLNNLDQNLLQLNLRFKELVGQEIYLEQMYTEILKESDED